MTALNCEIQLQADIADLINHQPEFSFLLNNMPNLSLASKWERKDGYSYDLQIIFIGKSGYGKSTTLNLLVGSEIFETSDVSGCTRKMQSAEFRFNTKQNHCNFSIADLPGIGENLELDEKYINLYRSAISKAHIVVYFLRADQRDFSIDHWAFSSLFRNDFEKSKVIIALNAIDKIEPINRNHPFAMTIAQVRNLEIKKRDIMRQLEISSLDIVTFSATQNYQLDHLIKILRKKLIQYLIPL